MPHDIFSNKQSRCYCKYNFPCDDKCTISYFWGYLSHHAGRRIFWLNNYPWAKIPSQELRWKIRGKCTDEKPKVRQHPYHMALQTPATQFYPPLTSIRQVKLMPKGSHILSLQDVTWSLSLQASLLGSIPQFKLQISDSHLVSRNAPPLDWIQRLQVWSAPSTRPTSLQAIPIVSAFKMGHLHTSVLGVWESWEVVFGI